MEGQLRAVRATPISRSFYTTPLLRETVNESSSAKSNSERAPAHAPTRRDEAVQANPAAAVGPWQLGAVGKRRATALVEPPHNLWQGWRQGWRRAEVQGKGAAI